MWILGTSEHQLVNLQQNRKSLLLLFTQLRQLRTTLSGLGSQDNSNIVVCIVVCVDIVT